MRRLFISLLGLLMSTSLSAQTDSSQIKRLPAKDVIDAAQRNNVLTFAGTPFHAVLDIQADPANAAYNGRVEVYWAAQNKYRVVVTSPAFDQTLIVNGTQIEEKDRGNFFPGWLQRFVTALLNPMPRLGDYTRPNDKVDVTPMLSTACVVRDDRTNGISDEMTKSRTCFTANDLRLNSAQDLTYFMMYEQYAPFASKQIARKYITIVDDEINLTGTFSSLDELNPVDESLFAVEHPTPPDARILTDFVPTATATTLLDHAPSNVAWPIVREGSLEGNMMVVAMTDRTGQVREAYGHNADNNQLMAFGRQVALQYKFKPLLVDGVAQQMEFPLTLHFVTHIENPIPDLDDKQSRKMISGCSVPKEISDHGLAGKMTEIVLQIGANGHFSAIHDIDKGVIIFPLFQLFSSCHYDVYKQNGTPTPYYAHLAVKAK